MRTEDFVTHEQTFALKRLGFREKCLYHYDNIGKLHPNSIYEEYDLVDDALLLINSEKRTGFACDAPTLWEAQGWLRKEKGFDVYAYPIINTKNDVKQYRWDICWGTYHLNDPKYGSDLTYLFNSYEEALSAGIIECIKILKDDKENQIRKIMGKKSYSLEV